MTDPRWLTDDEQRAWRAYLRMQARLTTELNRQLQSTSQLSLADYDVLVQLSDTPEGRLRPYALQRALDWEQSRLSHHLSRMQRRGLVQREECDDDGRGMFIVLSPEGRAALTAAAPGHVEAVRRLFFDTLTPGQSDAIHAVATQILKNLDD